MDAFSDIPLSLYIHLPWCIKKCPYCDFNSHAKTINESDQESYIDALLRDIHFESNRITKREIQSIFIGGGTPSLFSASALKRLFESIDQNFSINSDCEVTLEANPGAIEAEKFAAYYDLGINRISLGVQSFDNDQLKKLGRIHNSEEALKAIELAKKAGFTNFNIDLMYGLPEQTLQQALADINLAISLQPSHVSWYELTIEPNTVFYSHPPKLPDEDDIWQIRNSGIDLLTENGFKQYEVSAYGKKQCLHNLNYWEFGDYLGIGAGAHGKLSNPTTGAVERFARVKLPDSYIQKAGSKDAIASNYQLQQSDLIFEFMLNAFRLTDGFEKNLFSTRTGLSPKLIQNQFELASKQSLIKTVEEKIQTTDMGKRYLNDLIQIFLPEQKTGRQRKGEITPPQ